MIPVNNSSSLANRSLFGLRRPAGAGAVSSFASLYSEEELTYSNLGAPRFGDDRVVHQAPGGPDGAQNEGLPEGRNRFRDLAESKAVGFAATQSGASFVGGVSSAPPRQSLSPANQAQEPARKEPAWSISMVGNQVQLSFNGKRS
jgi:hypothetical protein